VTDVQRKSELLPVALMPLIHIHLSECSCVNTVLYVGLAEVMQLQILFQDGVTITNWNSNYLCSHFYCLITISTRNLSHLAQTVILQHCRPSTVQLMFQWFMTDVAQTPCMGALFIIYGPTRMSRLHNVAMFNSVPECALQYYWAVCIFRFLSIFFPFILYTVDH
jgi:hypothetical protein